MSQSDPASVCPRPVHSRYRLYWGDRDNRYPNTRAHLQRVIDVIAEIGKVGATTDEEWYDDLCNHTLTMNKWYDHVAVDKASNKESEKGVMDSTMPLAVVDTDMTSNIGKYVDGLHLTGRPSQ